MTEGGARVNLLDLNREGLVEFFEGMGERSFRASQIMKWIYHHGIDDFSAMTDLSKGLRERLQAQAEVHLPEVVAQHPSSDGTQKWVLRLDEANSVETVFIPDGGRGTLCVSSQVGCTLACTFCSTGRQGFNRNLTCGEIIGQVVVASRMLGLPANKGERVITNVVMMGMGEPLLNMEALLPALELMQDDCAFGISKRRVTVSTAGVVPAIDELSRNSGVCLAVSLHAPNDALRDTLVPLNRKYPLRELLAACRRYVSGRPGQRVTIEYTLIKGVNDSAQHARDLLKLLREVPSKVNLIPFNPFPGSHYQPPTAEVVDIFREILMAGGIITVTRKTRGDDIAAACGQLVGEVSDRTRRSHRLMAQTGGGV